MAKKLFVGGLSWNTSDENLHHAFSAFGKVSDAKVISDRETGRSRGFGFVTFDVDDEARSAVAALDGTVLDGRTIRVNEAEERRGGGGGDRRGPPRGGGFDRTPRW